MFADDLEKSQTEKYVYLKWDVDQERILQRLVMGM